MAFLFKQSTVEEVRKQLYIPWLR